MPTSESEKPRVVRAKDVAKKLSQEIRVPVYATKPYVEKLFRIMRDLLCSLPDGGKVTIAGFGTWTVVQRRGTKNEIVNWRTGKRVVMDSRVRQASFTPSIGLRKQLQGKKVK